MGSGTGNFRRRLDIHLSTLDHAQRRKSEEQAALKKSERRIACVLEAQSILQRTAEAVQSVAHKQIAAVASKCLKAVFREDAYELAINFKRSRGKTEAHLKFKRGGQEVDPMDAAGGGAVDVAGFALRLACLMLAMPRKRKLLILDEPFSHLSRNYCPRVRKLLEAVTEEFGIQVVMVSHTKEFATGKVVEV